MSRRQVFAFFTIAIVLATAYAIVLQCDGQRDEARTFVRDAGFWIAIMVIMTPFLYAPRDEEEED